ncbi:MAG: substrate-binding domain-containing protein [Myxococcota bacterium]|nr:substrate-binding domain-containing protein [Myxococcota bacterium]
MTGVVVLVLSLFVSIAGADAAKTIVVASTTSTVNSGLFDHILPIFRERTGIVVKPLAVGTGQAIRIARRGDADVLFVHDRQSEETFVAEGFGVERHEVMYNDFVIVGPSADPARVGGVSDVALALEQIARARAPFASRGDDSGTHKAELRLWKAAGVDPHPDSGTWYRETGSGQGATLNVAAGMSAYMLSDRGTWLNFKNRRDLRLLVEADARLRNVYGLVLVNPKRHPHVNAGAGQVFIDWLISEEGQSAIGSLEVNGEPLFTPSARPES